MHPSVTEELFSLGQLERGRIDEPEADPWNVAPFSGLENAIRSSVTPVTEVKTQAEAPPAPVAAKPSLKQSLSNESLLQKLVQHREKIPRSNRIIRAEDT